VFFLKNLKFKKKKKKKAFLTNFLLEGPWTYLFC